MNEVDETEQGPLATLLKQGLHEIPTPAASPGFNARVLETARRSRFAWIPPYSLASALGVLLALLVAPATRWIVWSQAGLQLQGPRGVTAALRDMGVQDVPAEAPQEDPAVRATRAADRFGRNDFPLQLAAAEIRYSTQTTPPAGSNLEYVPTGQSVSDEIRALERRFPNNPSLLANAIRLDTSGRIRLKRQADEDILYPPRPQPNASATATPVYQNRPTDLNIFIRDCEKGERLEPDNGYFPMLRAAALFAAHKDNEALAALHKAAGLTRWDPHYADEVEGRWRLSRLTGGDRSAIHHMAIQAAVLFPELALIRGTSRVAIALAVRAELGGNRDAGLQIRKDVARCGALMRAEAPNLIGNLVGKAIPYIACARPGGAPPIKGQGVTTPNPNVTRYTTYLKSIGAADEARWIQDEVNIANAATSSVLPATDESPAGMKAMVRLCLYWLSGMALFGNTFWLLLLGVLGTLYIHRWKARHAAGWAHEDMFVLLVGGSCVLMALGLLAWNQGQSALMIYQFAAAMGSIYSGGNGIGSDAGTIRFGAICVLVALPAMLGALALIVAAVRRRPLLLELARAYRAVGLVMAALLMIGYAAMITRTARAEAEMNAALTATTVHEGRYLSNFVGAKWPGLKH